MNIVIIPCRGGGTRVREHRHDGHKLLLRVGNKAVIQHQVEQISAFADVYVSVIPQFADDLVSRINDDAIIIADSEQTSEERDGCGVALSLWLSIKDISLPETTPTTIWFSDTLLGPDALSASLLESHTVLVSHVSDGSRFVNVETDNWGNVTRWTDHPNDGKPALATIGVYTLPLGEWRRILQKQIEIDSGSYAFFGDTYMRALHTWGWFDVGTEESYEATQAAFRLYREGAGD